MIRDNAVWYPAKVCGDAARKQAPARLPHPLTRRDTNLTTALQSAIGRPITIGDYRQIRAQITVLRDAPLGHYQPATLTATWSGDDTRTDRAKASVRVTP